MTNKSLSKTNHTTALIFLTIIFFICGFSAVFNDILIPYLKHTLNISYQSAVLIQVSFYFAYFVSSPICGILCRHRNLLWGIRLGLITGFFGTFCIYLASKLMLFSFILFGIFILGSGVAFLQVSANPYVLFLGDQKFAASRLSFTQTFTSIGAVFSSFTGSHYILSTLDHNDIIKSSPLQTPYLILSHIWISLFFITYLFKLPKTQNQYVHSSTSKKEKLFVKNPIVIFGIFAILIGIGLEVTVGSYLFSFLENLNIKNLSMEHIGKYTIFFWGGFMIGRLLGSLLLRKLPPYKLLYFCTLLGTFFTTVAILSSGYLAIISILALGLCISLLFPLIFSITISSAHSRKSEISGLLCMANIGGALIPFLQGFIGDHIGIHFSFLIPLLCFLFLSYFAYLVHSQKKPLLT